MSSYEYEDRIILFADILGTKSLVEQSIDDSKLLNSVCSLIDHISANLNRIQNRHADQESYRIDYCVSFFSDSFVVSIKFDPLQRTMIGFAVTTVLQMLTELFMSLRILVRGGVTIGKLVHTERVLFGPAMVEAYHLESKVAKTPRIIFSQELLSTFLLPTAIPSIAVPLKLDSDGYYYYDYVSSQHHPAIDQKIGHMIRLLDCLTDLRKYLPHLNEKYNWLRKKILDFDDEINGSNLEIDIEYPGRFSPSYTEIHKQTMKSTLREYLATIELLRQERDFEQLHRGLEGAPTHD